MKLHKTIKWRGVVLHKRLAVFLVGAMVACAACAKPPTKVQFWFDTEDYTYDPSNDAIRDLANLLTEEGVRGHFNIVGYLAKFILEKRRFDVIDALKPHLVGSQTMYHSYHPNVVEMTDLADYDAAYRLAAVQESESAGMLKAVFGRDTLAFAVQPGPGSSYVALDVYADQGIPIFGDMGALRQPDRGLLWYQNMLQVPYNGGALESFLPGKFEKFDLEKTLDRCAKQEYAVFSMHPHMMVRVRHWDIDNFKCGNNVEFGKWNPPELRSKADYDITLKRLRDFVRRLKADPRFVFSDTDEIMAQLKPRVPITAADVPAIRRSLLASFGPVSSPASWSVADCFQAAVRLLRGEKEYRPGHVYGFLSRPEGVKTPVNVKAADLRAAAARIAFRRHLPAAYDVGGVTLGPADLLFAALEVLETGADEVTVTPRDQLGDIASRLPSLATFTHRGRWIYWPQFKDEYLSDRLRLQYWTLRYE